MNKAFIGAGIALGLALAGCNNDLGVYTVGAPTAIINFKTITASLASGQGSVGYTIEAYSVPGSPAGIVQAFVTRSGLDLPIGLYVEKCIVSGTGGAINQKPCGPFASGAISQSFPSTSLEDFDIVGLRVQALNGYSKVVQWTGSQPLLVQVSPKP